MKTGEISDDDSVLKLSFLNISKKIIETPINCFRFKKQYFIYKTSYEI